MLEITVTRLREEICEEVISSSSRLKLKVASDASMRYEM
jgi:hypothetical protein